MTDTLQLAAVALDVAEIKTRLARIDAALGATPPHMKSATLTVEETARELRRSTKWVYEQLYLGRIRRLRTGKPYQIPRSEIIRIQHET